MIPIVEYDAVANAAYIRFTKESIRESEEVSAGIALDYDERGHIFGMEVLNARDHLSPAMLVQAA